ncbi:MAG: hypothetical protein IH991_00150 [Planctomycetes bacterium]|nr:hypothetical protein [Planctomycetota bacterium]
MNGCRRSQVGAKPFGSHSNLKNPENPNLGVSHDSTAKTGATLECPEHHFTNRSSGICNVSESEHRTHTRFCLRALGGELKLRFRRRILEVLAATALSATRLETHSDSSST